MEDNNSLYINSDIKKNFSKYSNSEADVCGFCFNEPNKCTCENDIKGLYLKIDKGLHEHIKILNDKGYGTNFCCEGHSAGDNMYIKFAGIFDFGIIKNNPPENFKVIPSNKIIEYKFNKNLTMKEFELQHKKQLGILLEWAKKLPKTKNADFYKNLLINEARNRKLRDTN